MLVMDKPVPLEFTAAIVIHTKLVILQDVRIKAESPERVCHWACC